MTMNGDYMLEEKSRFGRHPGIVPMGASGRSGVMYGVFRRYVRSVPAGVSGRSDGRFGSCRRHLYPHR